MNDPFLVAISAWQVVGLVTAIAAVIGLAVLITYLFGMYDAPGFIAFFGVGLLIVFVIIVFAVRAANAGSEKSCRQTAAAMNVEQRYSYRTGCLIRVDERWIPLDAYKVVEER